MSGEQDWLCPSAAPRDIGDAIVIGIVGGTPERPRMQPLAQPEPLTEDVIALAAPHHVTEVFRLASPCMKSGCKNFGADGHCKLAEWAAGTRSASDEPLPFCKIRPTCLWWHQEGRAACRKCPDIVTNNARSRAKRAAAVRTRSQAAADEPVHDPAPNAGDAGSTFPIPVISKE